jgi:hypothetical protein
MRVGAHENVKEIRDPSSFFYGRKSIEFCWAKVPGAADTHVIAAASHHLDTTSARAAPGPYDSKL